MSGLSDNDKRLLMANMNHETTWMDFQNDFRLYTKHIKIIEEHENVKILVLDSVNLYRASTRKMCHNEYIKLVGESPEEEFKHLCCWLCIFIATILKKYEPNIHVIIDAVVKLPTYYYNFTEDNPRPCDQKNKNIWYDKKNSSYDVMKNVCNKGAHNYLHASFLTIKDYITKGNINAVVRYSICIPDFIKTVYLHTNVEVPNEEKRSKKALNKLKKKEKKRSMRNSDPNPNSSYMVRSTASNDFDKIDATKDYDDLICTKKAIFYRNFDETCSVISCDSFYTNSINIPSTKDDIFTLDESLEGTPHRKGDKYKILHIKSISIDVMEIMFDSSMNNESKYIIHKPNTFWGLPKSDSFYSGIIQKPCVKFECNEDILKNLGSECSDSNFVKIGNKKGKDHQLLIYPKIVSNNSMLFSNEKWDAMDDNTKLQLLLDDANEENIRLTEEMFERVSKQILERIKNGNEKSPKKTLVYNDVPVLYAHEIEKENTESVKYCIRLFKKMDYSGINNIIEDFSEKFSTFVDFTPLNQI